MLQLNYCEVTLNVEGKNKIAMEVMRHYYNLWANSPWGKKDIYKEDNSLLCLKSKINLCGANVAWSKKSDNNIEVIKSFFQQNEFYLYSDKPVNSSHVNFISIVEEMVLTELEAINIAAKIKHYDSALMYHQPDLSFWNYVFTKSSNKYIYGMYDFIKLLKESSNFYTLLMFLPNGPVATACISIKNGIGLLNFISVMQNYRRQNIGSMILTMSLHFGIRLGVKKFILYSPKEISNFYNKVGFRSNKHYYLYNSHSPG